MRPIRHLIGLVAAAALLLAGLVAAPGAAVAAPSDGVTAERALPTHEFEYLRANKVKGTKSRFYVAGKIYTYKGKRVKIQKSNREKGVYRTVKQTRTNKFGKFRGEFYATPGEHIRLVVPGTPRNRLTKVYIGKIVRKYA